MKLLEAYSRSCSVDIKSQNKCYLYPKYFPLCLDKYITIQNKSGMPAKDYTLTQEVVDILYPFLDKHNITMVLLGTPDAPPLSKVLDLRGQTSINQAAYILNHSLCHFSMDSWSCHYCGENDIPLVALYGSTSIKNHGPARYNKDKTILIESHRNGNLPSFQREENPKMIDLINSEDVAKSIVKLLNLEMDYPFETKHVGLSYHNKMVESACDSVINPQQLGIPSLIMKLDYNFNLAVLINQLQICKCTIVTEKPVPIEILKQFKGNIIEVIYKIKMDHDPSFVKGLFESKIPYRLFSEMEEKDLNPIKLDYIDYGIITKRNINKPEKLNNCDLKNLYYKSSKLTLGRGKIYQSKADYFNEREIGNIQVYPQEVQEKNLNLLWEEEEYLIFLEKTSTKT